MLLNPILSSPHWPVVISCLVAAATPPRTCHDTVPVLLKMGLWGRQGTSRAPYPCSLQGIWEGLSIDEGWPCRVLWSAEWEQEWHLPPNVRTGSCPQETTRDLLLIRKSSKFKHSGSPSQHPGPAVLEGGLHWK